MILDECTCTMDRQNKTRYNKEFDIRLEHYGNVRGKYFNS